MERKNELDDLLKRNMQFDANEIPEPDPRIQKRLHKRVEKNKQHTSKGFIPGILQLLNMDIKLYHAGIAVAIISALFLVLRRTTEPQDHFKQNVIVADTAGSSFKDDSFLVKNFSTTLN